MSHVTIIQSEMVFFCIVHEKQNGRHQINWFVSTFALLWIVLDFIEKTEEIKSNQTSLTRQGCFRWGRFALKNNSWMTESLRKHIHWGKRLQCWNEPKLRGSPLNIQRERKKQHHITISKPCSLTSNPVAFKKGSSYTPRPINTQWVQDPYNPLSGHTRY